MLMLILFSDVNKQFQKSRRREPSNSNGSRLDQNRKPAPQKNKTDKRPRPRGQYYGSGKESAQVSFILIYFKFFLNIVIFIVTVIS